MTQSDDKKKSSSTNINEKSESRPSKVKLEGTQSESLKEPQSFVLPPKDHRLENRVVYKRIGTLRSEPKPEPKPTLLEKIGRFFSRLFGK